MRYVCRIKDRNRAPSLRKQGRRQLRQEVKVKELAVVKYVGRDGLNSSVLEAQTQRHTKSKRVRYATQTRFESPCCRSTFNFVQAPGGSIALGGEMAFVVPKGQGLGKGLAGLRK